MLVMTAKVDKRKIILALVAVLAAVGIVTAAAWGSSGRSGQPAPSAPGETTDSTAPTRSETVPQKAAAGTNDARVKFLTDLGWEVTVSPTESMEVKLPKDSDELFQRYNALQKSQGFDLSRYAGKTVMRYVYRVENYPGATEPVYATVLVYKDRIIGGDVTNTAPDGKVQSFVREAPSQP